MRSIYKCVICGSYTEDTVHCGVQARLLLDGKLRSRLSHLMTYLLRHDPSAVNLSMDSEGWVSIDELVHALRDKWDPKAYSWLTKEHIMAVASLDPKGRFEIRDGMIRARYGHNKSLDVNIRYEVDSEVRTLYHGTTKRALVRIMREGIKPMNRKYVHLVLDPRDAYEVALRHGNDVVILKINVDCLRRNDQQILIATDRIRLTDYVPPQCIESVIDPRN
ncbi:RNA 2'-phosphotransferase [Vulcanisaeta distributa]|uniref:Probable RNA 2'-phosphotransferase n=1 Tax=Vulcanisaeta distributa (strain DSM 14429 / JCM 11212 / NBRC 100878 / IC-017) TaxID=572478 RepID=E1QUN8_VULDI|nr:RNA 2'-phosphotransferase [Vulcanisaeta distributa]ADN51157.1 phosphotransferase KptA/Tpt1 [Vulcanisaeta distributa DSM 14429]